MRQSRNDKFQISEFQIVGTRHATSENKDKGQKTKLFEDLKIAAFLNANNSLCAFFLRSALLKQVWHCACLSKKFIIKRRLFPLRGKRERGLKLETKIAAAILRNNLDFLQTSCATEKKSLPLYIE